VAWNCRAQGYSQADHRHPGRRDKAYRRGAAICRCGFSNRIGDAVIAGILAIGGAFVAWQALLLGIGDAGAPGAGFFPFLLGIILLLIALVIGFAGWLTAPAQAVELGHRDVTIAIAILLLVPALFEPIGAPITLGLFAVASLVLIGRISPLLAIPASFIATLGCWYFFHELLGVQLPTGPL
jgi:putative tricarboxylic transport membrane protein